MGLRFEEGPNELVCTDDIPAPCRQIITNRFQHIGFKDIWVFEFWAGLYLTIGYVFLLKVRTVWVNAVKEGSEQANSTSTSERASTAGDHSTRHRQKVRCSSAENGSNEIKFYEEDDKHIKASRSRFALIIYFFALISRIALEAFLIWMTYQLMVHQTGESGYKAFYSKEVVDVPTFNGYSFSDNTAMQLHFPNRKFSNLFIETNRIDACSGVKVSCAQADNYRKTKAVIAMWAISIGSVTISFLELLWLFNRLCRGTAPGYFDHEEHE